MDEKEFFEEESDGLTLEELENKTSFIKSPKVGETVELTIKKLDKVSGKDCEFKDKEGNTQSTALSKVDYCFKITTVDDAVFTVQVWEVWGKIKAILQKLKKIAGVTIKVDHVLDGRLDRKKDSYKVSAKVDGEWKTLPKDSDKWE